MNKIRIDNPKGIVPGVAAHRLPPNFAQKAYNCNFDKGVLNAVADLNIDSTFSDPGALRSLYKYDDIWVYWLESDINALRLQLAASDDRVMYTGDGYPKQFDSNLMAASGIPTMDQATITGVSNANPCVITAVGHGFSNGNTVGLFEIEGAAALKLALNGLDFVLTRLTDDTFSVPVNTTASGAYSSGGTATKTQTNRRVGIPAPTDEITTAESGVGEGGSVVKYTLAYVYTYVVKWSDGTEEESPPSPVTTVLDVRGAQHVAITSMITSPTLLSSGNNITHVRVYRTIVSSDGSVEYRLVKMRDTSYDQTTLFWYDIPIANWVAGNTLYDSDGTTKDIWDNSADTAIQTTDWANPPTDLAGLIQYQNGILAGFSGRKICLCEPFVHYAWPTGNQLEVDYDPIALGVYAKSLIVGTDAYPYVIYGTNVDTMGKDRLPWMQACLSARGMISTSDGVIYPCPDGLFLINYSTGWAGRVVSKGVITKEDWEALPPTGKTWADVMSFYYDDTYYAVFAGTNQGFAFNFKEDPYFKKLLFAPAELIYHGLIDEEDDDLILLTNIGGDDYYAKEYDRSTSDTTFKWKSKEFQTQAKNYAACEVRGSQSTSSPLILRPFGDGVQLQRKNVESSELPSSLVAHWKFDGDATDEEGTYDATLNGGKWGAGPTGYALDLNGTDEYADTGDTFQSTLRASFGFSFWVCVDDGNPGGTEFFIGCTNASGEDYVYFFNNTTGTLGFYYEANNISCICSEPWVFSNGLNEWKHIVGTYDAVGNIGYLYVNGVIAKTVSAPTMVAANYTSTLDITIGAHNNNGATEYFFNGRIADVRLYSQLITAAQALALYNEIWFKEVTDEKPFRLPGHKMFKSHETEILGKTETESITLATSVDELE